MDDPRETRPDLSDHAIDLADEIHYPLIEPQVPDWRRMARVAEGLRRALLRLETS